MIDGRDIDINNLLVTKTNNERDLIRIPTNPDTIHSMRITISNKPPMRHKIVLDFVLIRHSNFSLNNTHYIYMITRNKLCDFFFLKRSIQPSNVPVANNHNKIKQISYLKSLLSWSSQSYSESPWDQSNLVSFLEKALIHLAGFGGL